MTRATKSGLGKFARIKISTRSLINMEPLSQAVENLELSAVSFCSGFVSLS